MKIPEIFQKQLSSPELIIPGDLVFPSEIGPWGKFLFAIATCQIYPFTGNSQRLLLSCRGRIQPNTIFEKGWKKALASKGVFLGLNHCEICIVNKRQTEWDTLKVCLSCARELTSFKEGKRSQRISFLLFLSYYYKEIEFRWPYLESSKDGVYSYPKLYILNHPEISKHLCTKFQILEAERIYKDIHLDQIPGFLGAYERIPSKLRSAAIYLQDSNSNDKLTEKETERLICKYGCIWGDLKVDPSICYKIKKCRFCRRVEKVEEEHSLEEIWKETCLLINKCIRCGKVFSESRVHDRRTTYKENLIIQTCIRCGDTISLRNSYDPDVSSIDEIQSDNPNFD